MKDAIEAVIESADFGPHYDGETFVTVTFRVPSDTRVPAGVWELRPVRPLIPDQPQWSVSKSEKASPK